MRLHPVLRKLFPIFYGLLVYATIRLLQDTDSGIRFWNRTLFINILEVCISIGVAYLNIGLLHWHFGKKNVQIAGSKFTSAQFFRELLAVFVINGVLVNLILTPMAALTDDGLSVSDFVYINTIPFLYMLIYYGLWRSLTFLKAYIQHQLLVEKLTNDQLETELKFLKAQYHPHFLFNALNTIYFQMDSDVPGAKKSTELLSELLRYQLYDQQQRVPVSQELAHLKNYIGLQQVRVSKKLKLQIEFEEALQEQLIYPLLLLPLVENAFKYVGGGYTINIECKKTSNGLLFAVRNDCMAQTAKREDSGIGQDNLKRRLELLYPNRHSLKLSQQNGHYLAELELKFEQ